MPRDSTWRSVKFGKPGMEIGYSLRAYNNDVSLWMRDKKNYYDALLNKKNDIEKEFGNKLTWNSSSGKFGAAIYFKMDGGYKSPVGEINDIQQKMIDAMVKLEQVLRSRIAALPQD